MKGYLLTFARNLFLRSRSRGSRFVRLDEEALSSIIHRADLQIEHSIEMEETFTALQQLPEEATNSEIVLASARAFANANPSTFAALIAGGLLAGSKTLGADPELDGDSAATFVAACAGSIAQRGRAELGDKTILDVLVPAGEAMKTSPGARLDAALTASRKALADITELRSRRGRASWLQERSIGLQDPGATAFVRFLEAWQAAGARHVS